MVGRMRLDPDGAELFPAAFTPAEIAALEALLQILYSADDLPSGLEWPGI